jgi:carboxyl-terminal processing protease
MTSFRNSAPKRSFLARLISSLIALLSVSSASLAVGEAPPPRRVTTVQPLNRGFEQSSQGQPTGWQFKSNPDGAFVFETARGQTRLGARLHFLNARSGTASATIFQSLDATSLRGRLVRVRIALRLASPSAHPVLFANVFRPGGRFASYTAEEPRSGTKDGWQLYEVNGRIASDAQTVLVGVSVRGEADVLADNLAFETRIPAAAPPTAAAKAYFAKAIAIIRAHHVNAAYVDWPAITVEANAQLAGASAPRDTYPAIIGVVGALGEPHSRFVAPPHPRGGTSRSPSALPVPTGETLDPHIGLVRLPAVDTLKSGQRAGVFYSAALKRQLERLDGNAACGWIVDLRRDSGGDMWPMLKGLDPLLGQAPFGGFVRPDRSRQYWERRNGAIVPSSKLGAVAPPAFVIQNSDKPVVVIIGPQTGSAGEMTALALIGRTGVRTFGAPSAGLTSANEIFPLEDGAHLVLTTSAAFDRTGKTYAGPVLPDQPVADASVEGAAREWLASQCRTRADDGSSGSFPGRGR